MSWLFRPSLLVVVSAALTVLAGTLVFWPDLDRGRESPLMPRPVPAGDQEVVWLNPATSAVSWERFVTAVRRVQTTYPQFALKIDETHAFPPQTAAVPELVLRRPDVNGRLLIRWYKLSADARIDQWVEALARRQPPPLAIIGGGSSDRARDLAEKLGTITERLGPVTPLLLITTATADEVAAGDDPSRSVPLQSLHPNRTFRYCFTNQQMAEAVTDFIWGFPELRPDAEPSYIVAWRDDPYSEDLADRFRQVLWSDRYRGGLQSQRTAREATRLFGWALSLDPGGPGGALGGWPLYRDELIAPGPFWRARIPYSVGAFAHPNRPEAEAAEMLIDELQQHPSQQRPLLVLPATAQPARRFLRGLMQVAPAIAERFVVVTGDSIDFNTLCRDRRLGWPIQDLPYALVVFCHHSPVDADAYRPDRQTGTEDLLLFADIVASVCEAVWQRGALLTTANELGDQLRIGTVVRFDEDGNRARGTGEYVLHLQPQRSGGRILPRSRLQVYRGMGTPEREWRLVHELDLEYERRRGGSAEVNQ